MTNRELYERCAISDRDSPPLTLGVQRSTPYPLGDDLGAEPDGGSCEESNGKYRLGSCTATWMTAGNPPFGLLDLPIEILENVILWLHAREILTLRIVRLTFLLLRSRLYRKSKFDRIFL